jgi:hypothetical protein
MMVEVANQASRAGSWNTFLPILWEAMRFGKPKLIDFQLYFSMWLIPQEMRRSFRALVTKKL